ncbi:Structural maintenance of chromosomes protein 1 [Cyphellophora attinorum]|uniref:Structural maintenance of chromosomes protein 1 n=1 Tax=Cyphellophora attinorum TaxID=1664694 RepID=A0A0N1H6J6_9EURO|nr:Structural maintenance of chromosomes protein 1 [Phialophora attinorum]KPI41684.1 Structural maintenance of chromosomes protein 1 [Phialophora attinorum]
MDAISFVLGIKSAHLRSTHLSELVYRGRVLRKSVANGDVATNGVNGHHEEEEGSQVNGTQERNDPKSAWVMAVYEDDAGEEQRWKRTITNQGVSEYRLNERVVTAQAYNESLETENILIKARNFLVFQGDVEAIAIQKPQDLTKLIEQVSGSLEFKAEYDKLKDESDEAAEQQTYQLNRRRGINSEKKQYEEQKREADKFVQKAAERDEAIVTHSLWKLFHLQRQIEESSAEIQKFQAELKDFQRGIEKYTKDLDTAKTEHAKSARAVTKAEKEIKAKEAEIEDKHSSLVPIDEQISVSNKALSKYQSRINTVNKERSTQAASVDDLEKQIKKVDSAQARWQEKWDQDTGKHSGQLSAAALQQYSRLRRINRLKADRAPVEANYKHLKNDLETEDFKLKAIENDLSALRTSKANVADFVKQTQLEITEKKKELNAVRGKRMQISRQKTELEEKLQDVLRKLVEADDGRRATQKELAMRETISMLKRTYPGACIEYLRDHRSGQATFLPLDTIQARSANPNLKGMHKGMRPALDTIDYGNDVARAISSACGNAIVCDTMDIAKELVFRRKVDAKAVTLDGNVIHKGGLMTGGRGRESNTRKWDDAELDKLNMLKDKLMNDMSALPQERSHQVEEQTLTSDLTGLEGRLAAAEEEESAFERNIEGKAAEAKAIKEKVKNKKPQMRDLEGKLEQIDDDIQNYEASVIQVENEVFGGFCAEHGFDDIRDYEARQGSLQQEASTKKLEFVQQKTKLEATLSYEKMRLETIDERIRAILDKQQRDRDRIDELNSEKQGIEDDLNTLEAELQDLNGALAELQEDYETKGQTLAKNKQEVAKKTKEMDGTLKSIANHEGDMQRVSQQRYALLRRCKIENIEIPLLESSATLDSLPINEMQHQDPDAMDVDDDDDPTESALQAGNAGSDHGIFPDFEVLDSDLQEQFSPEVDAELQENITKLNAALEKMQPNAHAAQRLTAVQQRLRDTDQEFENSRSRYTEKKNAFEEVRTKRNDLFQKAFSHISEQIVPIYADLTKSEEYTAGGRAYLTADDEEPYLAGVNYQTMPPAKTFRDMEHLSGGEKTMAALALLFAIHSYQPSPFFVLDEVDAALDNANVAKLVNYVRGHKGPGMQFIVISLKTGFFQGSEALVGVYRDQGGNSSRALTLDLRKYD